MLEPTSILTDVQLQTCTAHAWLRKQLSAALSTPCECASATAAGHCTVSDSLPKSGRPACEQSKGPGRQRRTSILCGSGGGIVTYWKTGREKPAKGCTWMNVSSTVASSLGTHDLIFTDRYTEWRCGVRNLPADCIGPSIFLIYIFQGFGHEISFLII